MVKHRWYTNQHWPNSSTHLSPAQLRENWRRGVERRLGGHPPAAAPKHLRCSLLLFLELKTLLIQFLVISSFWSLLIRLLETMHVKNRKPMYPSVWSGLQVDTVCVGNDLRESDIVEHVHAMQDQSAKPSFPMEEDLKGVRPLTFHFYKEKPPIW